MKPIGYKNYKVGTRVATDPSIVTQLRGLYPGYGGAHVPNAAPNFLDHIEPGILPIVRALTQKGFRTVESCEGHADRNYSSAYCSFAVPSYHRRSAIRSMRSVGLMVKPTTYLETPAQDRKRMNEWFGENLWELLRLKTKDAEADAQKILSLPDPSENDITDFLMNSSIQALPIGGACRYLQINTDLIPKPGFSAIAFVTESMTFDESKPMVFDLAYYDALGIDPYDCKASIEAGLLIEDY